MVMNMIMMTILAQKILVTNTKSSSSMPLFMTNVFAFLTQSRRHLGYPRHHQHHHHNQDHHGHQDLHDHPPPNHLYEDDRTALVAELRICLSSLTSPQLRRPHFTFVEMVVKVFMMFFGKIIAFVVIIKLINFLITRLYQVPDIAKGS